MKRFDQERHYSIKLMPNIINPVISITYAYVKGRMKNYNHRFHASYVLCDGVVDVYLLPMQFVMIADRFSRGDISVNNNGLILGDGNISCYYFDKSGDVFTSLYNDVKTEQTIFHDVIKIESPQILHDLKCEYWLEFDVEKTSIDGVPVIKYKNVSISKHEPMFKDGDNKDDILKMYDSVGNIDVELNKFINNTIKENPKIYRGNDEILPRELYKKYVDGEKLNKEELKSIVKHLLNEIETITNCIQQIKHYEIFTNI